MGYWGIGIERCWKRLFKSRLYLWKLNAVKFFETLIKTNYWSFDLKFIIPWFGIDLRPVPVLEAQHGELLSEHVVSRHRALKHISSRSRYRPFSSY